MELGLAYKELLSPTHRRALADAADILIDTTLDDLAATNDPTWSNDRWLIGTMLPPRYQLHYDALFAKQFFLCLTTVIWKLGQPEPMRPSCVAEELAAHVLIEEAKVLLEQGDVEAEFGDFEDGFFEDLDFEYLYDDAYDGIEQADVVEKMGTTHLAFPDWFKRFGPSGRPGYTEVHPYARTVGESEGDSSA